MIRTVFLTAALAVSFAAAGFAQTQMPAQPQPDKAAMHAAKDACRTEAKAQNIVDKAQHKTFMKDCLKG